MCIFWLCWWELNTHSALLEEAQKANLKNEVLSIGYEIGWKQHCLLACVNIVEHSEFWRTDEVFWAGCVMMEIVILEDSKLQECFSVWHSPFLVIRFLVFCFLLFFGGNDRNKQSRLRGCFYPQGSGNNDLWLNSDQRN